MAEVDDKPTELERVLAALERPDNGAHQISRGLHTAVADAARLLREMAADFDKYSTDHDISCVLAHGDLVDQFTPCDCGLDAARARWRLLQ